MAREGSVLDRLYKRLNQGENAQVTSTIKDKKTGRRIGYRAQIKMDYGETEDVVATGFKYLPDQPETIGVMRKIARIGKAEDRLVLVYFGDRQFDRSLVFHPEAHADYGVTETKDADRQERGEQWLNLKREWGCTLRRYAVGEAVPREEPTKQEEIERDGGWFDV